MLATFSSRLLSLFHSLKEKSWSVLLLKGHVTNAQVRAERCENCKSTTEVLTANYNNPNLLLYGCKDNKCKHRFLRLDLETEASKKMATPIIQTNQYEITPLERVTPKISS
jgi:hypothetical protein